ncbi:pRiA4b ORF-3-like protein [Ochrobactrum sp. BH3]|nr:pRiA4b ORF-3-like protein [Ochrobactrum sp. BH3]
MKRKNNSPPVPERKELERQLETLQHDSQKLQLDEATGNCPPEDVGGPWGYQEFCEALANPSHERHAEFLEWWAAAITIPSTSTSPNSTKPLMT